MRQAALAVSGTHRHHKPALGSLGVLFIGRWIRRAINLFSSTFRNDRFPPFF
jgi:hypothetical protein